MTGSTWAVRDAVVDDAAALVRIRWVMLEGIGSPQASLAWMPDAEAELRAQMTSGSMIGVVAEESGIVVSGALARVWRQLPGDGDDGTRAWIFSVATEAEHRRRGIGRAVVTRLVERLDAMGVHRVDLTASEEGAPLYRSLGFATASAPLLRRVRPAAES